MATPHVTGASAGILGTPPRPSPAQLKAALVDMATPVPGTSVYDQGGGLLDAGRAATQTVIARTATVDFGRVAFPTPSQDASCGARCLPQPRHQRHHPAADCRPGSPGRAARPGGHARVVDRPAHPARRPDQLHGGDPHRATANGAVQRPGDRGLRPDPAVAAGRGLQRAPTYRRHPTLRDRAGARAASLVQVLALDGPAFGFDTAVDGQRTLRLAPGRYHHDICWRMVVHRLGPPARHLHPWRHPLPGAAAYRRSPHPVGIGRSAAG